MQKGPDAEHPVLLGKYVPAYSALGASAAGAAEAGASTAGVSAAGAVSAFLAPPRRVLFLAALGAAEAIAVSLKSTNSMRAISEPSP